MKRIWIALAALTMAVVVLSCTELEPTPQFKKSEAGFTAQASTDEVSAIAADSLSNVVTFTWTDPEYSVGLPNSKFTVLVGAGGEDFTAFSTKSFLGVLSGSLQAKELNAIALKFGGTVGLPITLDIKVVASQDNNNEPKESAVMQLEVTPYGDLTLLATPTEVVCAAVTSSEKAVEFTWNTAFAGYSGVKKYFLQYAAADDDFDPMTSIEVSGFKKSFTQFELNKIAVANGVTPGEEGDVEFRVKAVIESGAVAYSNTATVSVTTYLAYNSIGIVGDATPGGWDIDTDMRRPDASKPTQWTVTVFLKAGKGAKFRADDAWGANWGAAAFPSGTGVQDGPNVVIPSDGYYKVDLNVATGAYNFTKLTTVDYSAVSLIGEQTGWGSDIVDLTQSATDDQIWTGTVTLTAGKLKFRANHDWGINWGPGSAPAAALSGYGVQDGGDMVIETAGDYFVYINVASGEYFFGRADRSTAFTDIGVVGSAQGSWDVDTNLIRNPANPYKWSGTIVLSTGEGKFRADNSWSINWGNNTFPSGVGRQDGPNVPVTEGTYTISFNTSTGEYTFVK